MKIFATRWVGVGRLLAPVLYIICPWFFSFSLNSRSTLDACASCKAADRISNLNTTARVWEWTMQTATNSSCQLTSASSCILKTLTKKFGFESSLNQPCQHGVKLKASLFFSVYCISAVKKEEIVHNFLLLSS